MFGHMDVAQRRGSDHGRSAICILLVLAAALVGVAVAPPAHAFSHAWDCERYSGNDCSDPGTPYHSWIEIYSFTHNGYVMYHVCAESITAAGNSRSTTDGHICNVDAFLRVSCLISSTPDSWGKVHWTDPGISQRYQIYGRGYSPSDSAC